MVISIFYEIDSDATRQLKQANSPTAKYEVLLLVDLSAFARRVIFIDAPVFTGADFLRSGFTRRTGERLTSLLAGARF